MSSTHARRASALAALFLSAACSLQTLDRDLKTAQSWATVEGEVRVPRWDGGPIQVAMYVRSDDPAEPLRVVRTARLDRPGRYTFTLRPGTYRLAAIVDSNRNDRLDPGEPIALPSRPLELAPSAARRGIDLVVNQRADVALVAARVQDEQPLRVGDVVPLDDPRFGAESGEAGLWRPLATLEEPRYGLFLLEPFDPARTPVVFVHGMGGFAAQFAPLVDSLDRTRFQAWVYQYPSAFPLDLVADGLDRSLERLRARFAVERACLVAHSMGGLVSRGYLKRRARDAPALVRGFATLASPLGGMRSAASGVTMSPVVVPAWRDLVPESDYLAGLYADALPAGVTYHLLFAYRPEGPTDGTVPIQSQLRAEAQREAAWIRGFETTHVGILSDPEVVAHVGALLDRCSPPAPPPPPARPGGALDSAARQ